MPYSEGLLDCFSRASGPAICLLLRGRTGHRDFAVIDRRDRFGGARMRSRVRHLHARRMRPGRLPQGIVHARQRKRSSQVIVAIPLPEAARNQRSVGWKVQFEHQARSDLAMSREEPRPHHRRRFLLVGWRRLSGVPRWNACREPTPAPAPARPTAPPPESAGAWAAAPGSPSRASPAA